MEPDEPPPVPCPVTNLPTPLSPGSLRIQFLNCFLNLKVKKPYVILRLADKQQKWLLSELNKSFEFSIGFHAQLFGTIQLDLFDTVSLFSDKHIGRSEIRLRTLETMPETFTSYYEIWDKKLSTGASSSIGRERAGVNNVGAFHLKFSYCPHQHTDTDLGNLLKPTSLVPEGSTNLLAEEQSQIDSKRHLQFHKQREKISGAKYKKYQEMEDQDYPDESSSNDEEEDLTGALMQSKKSLDKYDDDEEEEEMVKTPVKEESGWSGPADTAQVIKSIGKLLATFGQGFELSNMQVITGFTVLEKFYSDIPRNRTWDIVQDLSEIDMGSRFWKFSIASYGWKGLNFIGKGNGIFSDAIRGHSDAKSIVEYLSIPKQDLLAYEFRSAEAFRPSYFIARDRFTDSIVLSIRGTMSVMDTLTDLVCEYESWKGGFIHSGMKNSAMWFFKHVAPQLVAYTNQYATTNLIIVGHSLGAATAAILTIILSDYIDIFRKEEGQEFHLRSFGYAPACGLSLDLAENYKDIIQSYVFADDIVSKLSYGSMMDVKDLIIASSEACRDMGITEILWSGDMEGDKWKTAFQRIAQVRKRSLHLMENPRLYVAGQIYQFWLDPTPSNDTRIVVEKTSATKVCEEVIVKKSILLDHLPTNFDVAFRRARETLMMEGITKRPSTGNKGLLKQEGESLVEGHPIWSKMAELGLKGTTNISGGDGKIMGNDTSR